MTQTILESVFRFLRAHRHLSQNKTNKHTKTHSGKKAKLKSDMTAQLHRVTAPQKRKREKKEELLPFF